MSRVNRVNYTGADGASAVGPQPINASCDTKEKKRKKGLVCVVPDTASGPCRWEGGWFFARGLTSPETRFRGCGASLLDLCPASRSRRDITLRALTASRIMDPSPLVPGTLAGLELFIYWEKRPLCRSKQSLVSRSHSVYGPAAEKTITGDSFLRCGPLTSRRLAQPLRGHGIPIPRTWECPA